MPAGKLLLYLLRRDLRVADNPIFHNLSTQTDHGFDTLLPVYVFPRRQMETSGFLREGSTSPYPPALSQVGKFWRCGPHRAKFTAQAVWDLKSSLEALESGLEIHVGDHARVVEQFIRHFKNTDTPVGAVWMTEEVSAEEMDEQESVAAACAAAGVDFKLWADEKYFVDDRDTGLASPEELPDVFTTYRKTQEPLRERPRETVDVGGKLPRWPGASSLPLQLAPFTAATSLEDSIARLCKPLKYDLDHEPAMPQDTESAHPLQGGEGPAMERLIYLLESGAMNTYSDTRNGLLGADFSTKLSAYLALGCVSARQVHAKMLAFEDGTDDTFAGAKGYGEGENEGTKAVRFELLWRDYMRLCTKKFKKRLFSVSGFRQDDSASKKWRTNEDSSNSAAKAKGGESDADELKRILKRFFAGTTGMGLIDASLRELYLTGYTSNRARQNVASFFAKHLLIDWRYGAEWYESLLVDYDVSSNWANWQYVAGVGNDPRGDARIFNPVKQAFDYDKQGSYVRAWVPELKDLEKVENVFQPWTTTADDLEKHGLTDSILVTDPLKRIEFTVERKPRSNRRPYSRGRGRGGGRGGVPAQQAPGYGGGPMPMAPAAMMPIGAQPLYPPVGYDASQAYVWPTQPVVPPWAGAPSGAHPPMAQAQPPMGQPPMGQPAMGQPAGWNNGQVWYRDNSMPPNQGGMGNMGVFHGRGGYNYGHQPPPQ